jgi:hypothetical protein
MTTQTRNNRYTTTIHPNDNATHNNTQEEDSHSRVNPNQSVGDSMQLPKDDSRMRMFMQNPNGVSCGKMGDMDMILDHLKHMEVDLFVFPETNLDTHKPQVKRQVHNHFKKSIGRGTYKIEMTTSNAEYIGQYKPGGVMGGIIGSTIGRIIESGHDKYGRWVFQT